MPGHSRPKDGVASLAYVPGIPITLARPHVCSRDGRDKPGHDDALGSMPMTCPAERPQAFQQQLAQVLTNEFDHLPLVLQRKRLDPRPSHRPCRPGSRLTDIVVNDNIFCARPIAVPLRPGGRTTKGQQTQGPTRTAAALWEDHMRQHAAIAAALLICL